MLRLTGLRLDRGARTLYRDVNVAASAGERVGLVGSNGSGKSSLLGAVLGRVPIDSGSIDAPPADRIAWIDQDVESTSDRVIDFVMSGHAQLMNARAELQSAMRSKSDDGQDLRIALAHVHLGHLQPLVPQHPRQELAPVYRLQGGHHRQLFLTGEVRVEELVVRHPQRPLELLGHRLQGVGDEHAVLI